MTGLTAQNELEKAEADLKLSYLALEEACVAHEVAHVEYGGEHRSPPPFPYDKNDPRLSKILQALAKIREAEVARDDAKSRINAARLSLSQKAE